MFSSLGIGFSAPWLLVGLLVLPLLWILLRAVPPAPMLRFFPGVILLLGLKDDENQTDKTPWWLLLLRSLAIASLIIGFAGPVLNPDRAQVSPGPLLILMDGSWADARDWSVRMEQVETAIQDAALNNRPVAVASLTDELTAGPEFLAPDIWLSRLAGITPNAWEPDSDAAIDWATGLTGEFETFWFSDGLERDGRTAILRSLENRGEIRVFENSGSVFGLRPITFDGGIAEVSVVRADDQSAVSKEVHIIGLDPNGIERVFERIQIEFLPGETVASTKVAIQPELRNRISRIAIQQHATAASVVLSDDGLKRREVALFGASSDQEGLQLLSATHYLAQALSPSVDLVEGTFGDVILSAPDVIVLADVATLAPADAELVENWVREGGLLLRFAGPRLAASDVGRSGENPLMPVRLRAGGRTVGGTMSWGNPKKLQTFEQGSPFFGLQIPDDVEVSAQVIAEPDPNLSSRVIAALSDGTPLVTRKKIELGQVVLFHVTANAEWSTLPLSGLFVEMLERLSVSGIVGQPDADDLKGTTWVGDKILDGFGTLHDAENLPGVSGEDIADAKLSARMPPGLYRGEERTIALNVISSERVLAPAAWPVGTVVEDMVKTRERYLAAWFLLFATAVLLTDSIASLWVGGRLRTHVSGNIAAVLFLFLIQPNPARAQDDEFAINATSHVVLAHVLTGNAKVDQTAQAGLRGLSDILFRRTSVEPAEPVSVDIERDELAFFPFLYWPISTDQPQPSAEAVARLNWYLKSGGMILFDTRDADIAGFGSSSPNGRKLQQLAASLDIPALEPVPSDHVLTRTFYLLDDFPGRYVGRSVWIEAAPADAEIAEGMPFRNLNDNVTPVVIGGNDWAAAWAVDEVGSWMYPIGRGRTGDRQREIAYRFGVNLIMYVLTGNYKSDQVHVPALLDRLGQ